MAIYKVRKRNGSIETFDRTKIEYAIMQTIQSVGGDDFSHVTSLTDQVIKHMEQSCNMQIPDIEVIQDPLIVPKTETNTQNQPSKITTTPKINEKRANVESKNLQSSKIIYSYIVISHNIWSMKIMHQIAQYFHKYHIHHQSFFKKIAILKNRVYKCFRIFHSISALFLLMQ